MKLIFSMAAQVVQDLRKKDFFITTVESCTGGGLANALTNIEGVSEVMKGAFITYSNEQKVALGVSAEVIKRHTVYSLEVAEAMAGVGLLAATKADISVGITGSISRVDPANPNSQPGVVYISVANREKTISQKFVFSDEGERWELKERAIEAALNMVLEIL